MSRALKIFTLFIFASLQCLAADELADDKAKAMSPLEQVEDWLTTLDLVPPDEDIKGILRKMADDGIDSLQRVSFLSPSVMRSMGIRPARIPVLMRAIIQQMQHHKPSPLVDQEVRDWLERHDLGQYAQNFEEGGYRTRAVILNITPDALTGIGVFMPNHARHLLDMIIQTKKSLNIYKHAQEPDPKNVDVIQAWLIQGGLRADEASEVAQNLAGMGMDSLQRLPYLDVQLLRNADCNPAAMPLLMQRVLDEQHPEPKPFPHGGKVEQWLQDHDLGRYAKNFAAQGYQTQVTIESIYEHNLWEAGVFVPLHVRHLLDLVRVTKYGH